MEMNPLLCVEGHTPLFRNQVIKIWESHADFILSNVSKNVNKSMDLLWIHGYIAKQNLDL